MLLALRIYDAVVKGLIYLAVFGLVATIVVILYDVLSRNLGLPPVTATSAIVEYSLMICAMFAAPWLVRVQGHVSLSAFTSRLPCHAQAVLNKVTLATSAVAMGGLCFVSFTLGYEKWLSGEAEIRSIALPAWLLYAIMSCGFGLMTTELLRLLLRSEIYTGKEAEH